MAQTFFFYDLETSGLNPQQEDVHRLEGPGRGGQNVRLQGREPRAQPLRQAREQAGAPAGDLRLVRQSPLGENSGG